MDEMSKETYRIAWEKVKKDMRNIFRKYKIKRIFNGSN
jgi:hypothetical protein